MPAPSDRSSERSRALAGAFGDPALPRRVATALVGAGLVVAAVLGLPLAGLSLLAGLVAAAGAWEWSRLAGVDGLAGRVAYVLALAGFGAVAWQAGLVFMIDGLLVVAVGWWCAIAWWLATGGSPRAHAQRPSVGWLAAGVLVFPPLALGLSVLGAWEEGPGRWVLLYAVCLVWVADIGAYFAGRAFGRRPLAPAVSAGKTREGLAGGVVAVGIYALAAGWALGMSASGLVVWVGIGVVAGALSVAGDLLESVVKREAGVKDSGRMLPGHGGLLDRIDSLTAAIPVLALGLSALRATGAP
jgi:phosphatidate cytidylyltransferase